METRQQAEPDLSRPVPVGAPVDLGTRGVGFVRIASAARGTPDDVPIVLLHGLTASSGINWVHVFDAWAGDRTIVAPDLRGHGRGPVAPRTMSIDDHADDIEALLDALGFETATVVGYSMGGAVAQAFALSRPERVRALVLVATTSRFRMGPITRWTYGLGSLGAKLARRLPSGVAERATPRFVPHPDPDVRRFIIDETVRHSARDLTRNARALSQFRSTPDLGRITAPTSVVVTTQDRTVHPNAQRRLAELIPGADVVESPTGHSGLLWEPDVAVPRLLEAVTRAESRLGA